MGQTTRQPVLGVLTRTAPATSDVSDKAGRVVTDGSPSKIPRRSKAPLRCLQPPSPTRNRRRGTSDDGDEQKSPWRRSDVSLKFPLSDCEAERSPWVQR